MPLRVAAPPGERRNQEEQDRRGDERELLEHRGPVERLFVPAGDQREPQHEEQVGDDASGQRSPHDLRERVAHGDQGDDQLGRVPEAGVQEAADPRPKLLDIREPAEYDLVRLPDAILVTDGVVEEILQSWDRDTEIICYCHHGIRSLNAAAYLAEQGFTNVSSMNGGIDAWAKEIDPNLHQY